jgi:endonuclease/exonuclease/phosphatase family metal-dependent hydrolase
MESNELRLASYNVHKGVGTDMRRDPNRTISVLREIGADIVALQEVDRRFGDRAGVLDLGRLRRRPGWNRSRCRTGWAIARSAGTATFCC